MERVQFPFSRPLRAPIAPGDTLQALAARILGDEARWYELAKINGLVWPYIDTSGAGGRPDPSLLSIFGKVVGVGDTLAIPMPWTTAPPPLDPIGVDLQENGMLGELVRGQADLAGAYLRRLRTPRGYLPHRPTYGSRLHTFIGKPATVGTVLDIRREIGITLLQDPRTLEVVSVAADLQTDAVVTRSTVKTPLGPVEIAGDVRKFLPGPLPMEVPNV